MAYYLSSQVLIWVWFNSRIITQQILIYNDKVSEFGLTWELSQQILIYNVTSLSSNKKNSSWFGNM